jgi:hypothetical protein
MYGRFVAILLLSAKFVNRIGGRDLAALLVFCGLDELILTDVRFSDSAAWSATWIFRI